MSRLQAFPLIALTLVLVPCNSFGAQGPDSLLIEAQHLVAAERTEAAVPVLEQILEDWPDHVPAMRLLARLRLRGDDSRGAFHLYERILARNPDGIGDRVERARVLARLGRFRESQVAMRTLLEDNPEIVEAWGVLADATLWSGDVTKARSVALSGLRHNPGAVPLLSRLAHLEYRTGRVGGARSYQSQVLAMNPGLAGGEDYLGFYSPYRVEFGVLYEALSGLDPWRSAFIDVAWRPSGLWSPQLTVERINRFGEEDVSLKGGISYALHDDLILRFGAQGAPGAELVPRWGGQAESSWNFRPLWRLDTSLRVLDFKDGTVTVVQGGVARAVGTVWEMMYRFTWARDLEGGKDIAQTARIQWAPSSRTVAFLDLFRGSDVQRLTAAADARSITTYGLAAVWRFYLSSLWGMRLDMGYADRAGAYRRQSVGIGFIRHF